MGTTNGLSEAQAERLAMLAEELGEAAQAVGKVLRFGYDGHPAGRPHDNRGSLRAELTDVLAVATMLDRAGDVPFPSAAATAEAVQRKRWNSRHQVTEGD